MQTTQQRLLTALAAAFPGASQAEIARKIGLSQQRFNNYATGARRMDDDAVIGCAVALGWEVQPTVAAHKADCAATERERRFWQRLGTAAALAAVALLFREHAPALSHVAAFFPALPIMFVAAILTVAALLLFTRNSKDASRWCSTSTATGTAGSCAAAG